MNTELGPSSSICRHLDNVLRVAHLKNTENIESTPAFDAYAEHYKKVANDMDPAYMLVAIYPCYRLWNWFGKKLYAEVVCNIFYLAMGVMLSQWFVLENWNN